MQTVHFAYAGLDDQGVATDVSLLLDQDDFDLTDTVKLASKLEHFLRSCGLLLDREDLLITG